MLNVRKICFIISCLLFIAPHIVTCSKLTKESVSDICNTESFTVYEREIVGNVHVLWVPISRVSFSPPRRPPSSIANPFHSQLACSWVDVMVASSSSQLHTRTLSFSRGKVVHDYDDHAPQAPPIFDLQSMPHAPQALPIFDLQSMLEPLLESRHLELQQQIITHLKDLVRPLRDELSATRLWLACAARH